MTQSGQSFTHFGQFPHTVAASYVGCLLETAVARGAKRSALLQAADMSETDLIPANRRLPLNQLLSLFQIAQQQTGDSMIGLHMAQNVRPGTFSALGYAAMSGSNLGEALGMIPRYEALVYDGGRTQLELLADRFVVSWSSGLPDEVEFRALNEVIVAGWLNFGRWIAADTGQMLGVEFRHQAPADSSEYASFFACPVRCGAARNSLSGPLDLLTRPLVQHDDEVRRLMEQRAEALLARLKTDRALSNDVLALIQRMLPQQCPSLAMIADSLHMSERTLRRKLQAEGSSFKALLTQVRRQTAGHYVAHTSMSMLEIALLLGFESQSAFTSAFRQWFDCSPSEYRREEVS